MTEEINSILDNEISPDIQAIRELFSKKDIELKSELTDEQIADLLVLLHFAERNKSKAMKAFGYLYLKLMVSRKRKGREEYIKAIHGYQEKERVETIQEVGKTLR